MHSAISEERILKNIGKRPLNYAKNSKLRNLRLPHARPKESIKQEDA